MGRSLDIVDFSPSDGLTPIQTMKLNRNFKRLSQFVMVDQPNRIIEMIPGPDEMGTDDYNQLRNKPQIEAVTLQGDKSFEQLGLSPIGNAEILRLFS
jgi:hypothetical protein